MAPVDTRLGPGTLTLGTGPGVEFGAQIANVTLEPSQDSEDGTPTLADPDPLPEVTESWVLSGEAIQDFEAVAGFVNYCFDNALTVKAFSWVPNTDADVTYAGDVLITSTPIGGDVATQNKAAFEFPVQGVPERTDAGALMESSRSIAARRARRRSTLGVAAAPAKKDAKAKAES